VTLLVVSCQPVGGAELGQEVLCQATGGRRTALQSCSAETIGVKGQIERKRCVRLFWKDLLQRGIINSGYLKFSHEIRVKNLVWLELLEYLACITLKVATHIPLLSRSNSTRMYGLTFQKISHSPCCGNLYATYLCTGILIFCN
jgi:hypothetical protein